MDTLFTQLASRKSVHKHFNYYFALKKQLEELEEYADGAHAKHSMLTSNSGLVSQLNPDDFQTVEALKISATAERLCLKPAFSVQMSSPKQRRYSADERQNEKVVSVNQSINVRSGVVKDCGVKNFKSEDAARKNKKMWVLPTGWREKPKALR